MLREQEHRDGRTADRIVGDLVESRFRRLAAFRQLADITSADVMKSGLTDDELAEFLERLKHQRRGVSYDV